jgi:hypothetical protein
LSIFTKNIACFGEALAELYPVNGSSRRLYRRMRQFTIATCRVYLYNTKQNSPLRSEIPFREGISWRQGLPSKRWFWLKFSSISTTHLRIVLKIKNPTLKSCSAYETESIYACFRIVQFRFSSNNLSRIRRTFEILLIFPNNPWFNGSLCFSVMSSTNITWHFICVLCWSSEHLTLR